MRAPCGTGVDQCGSTGDADAGTVDEEADRSANSTRENLQ